MGRGVCVGCGEMKVERVEGLVVEDGGCLVLVRLLRCMRLVMGN